MRSLGCEGISKSQVSRICSEFDTVVTSFLERPLDGGPYRYLWLDALTQMSLSQDAARAAVEERSSAESALRGASGGEFSGLRAA